MKNCLILLLIVLSTYTVEAQPPKDTVRNYRRPSYVVKNGKYCRIDALPKKDTFSHVSDGIRYYHHSRDSMYFLGPRGKKQWIVRKRYPFL